MDNVMMKMARKLKYVHESDKGASMVYNGLLSSRPLYMKMSEGGHANLLRE